jgi:hypothetical protein
MEDDEGEGFEIDNCPTEGLLYLYYCFAAKNANFILAPAKIRRTCIAGKR